MAHAVTVSANMGVCGRYSSIVADLGGFIFFGCRIFSININNLSMTQSSLPLMVIFLAAGLGGIGGGWLSSRFVKTRLEHQRRPQGRAVGMRLVCPAGGGNAVGTKSVASGIVGRVGGGSALWFCGKSVHAGQRYRAEAGHQFRGGASAVWRGRWWGWFSRNSSRTSCILRTTIIWCRLPLLRWFTSLPSALCIC